MVEIDNLLNDKTRSFMYWIHNFGPNWFVEVWPENHYLHDHLKHKYVYMCNKHNSGSIALFYFFFELDNERQNDLISYVNNNYEN